MSEILNMMQEQMGREARTSWIYRSMAEWAADQNFPGAEKWLRGEAEEELTHMHRFAGYINRYAGQLPSLPPVEGQKVGFLDLTELFEEVLRLEIETTTHINEIAQAAALEGDMVAHHFMQWFLEVQIESVSVGRDMVRLLSSCGDHAAFLLADKLIGKTAN